MACPYVYVTLFAPFVLSVASDTNGSGCVSMEEESCLLQAPVQQHSQSVSFHTIATSTRAGDLKCFEKGWYWTPDMDGMRINTDSSGECQEHCLKTKHCKTFSYWPDGGCELQEKDGLKKPADEEKYYGVLSGQKVGCSCFDSGSYWQPNMDGKKTQQKNAEDCQEKCVFTKHCQAFSFWPDGGCQLQALGEGSELVVASNEKYLGVVFGPKLGCSCFVTGSYYYPNMKDKKIEVRNEYECQKHCSLTKHCKTFSFWPDRGCQLQDSSATEQKAAN